MTLNRQTIPGVSILDIVKGDVIVEGSGRNRRETKVRKIEHGACSTRGTHVNGNECYESIALVNVLAEKQKEEDLLWFSDEEMTIYTEAVNRRRFQDEYYDSVLDPQRPPSLKEVSEMLGIKLQPITEGFGEMGIKAQGVSESLRALMIGYSAINPVSEA